MNVWREVQGSARPDAVDTTSSKVYVYYNKDIEEHEVEMENGDTITMYTYLQKRIPVSEYSQLNSLATQTIMQAISDLEVSIFEIGG